MIKCNECGSENIEGLLYCDNCGAELSEDVEMTSGDNGEEEFIPVDGPSVKLIVMNTGEEIYLPEKEEVIIGREDPVSAVFPDIDTTAYGGEEDGVSRQHAKIFRQGDSYYVEDMNSVNSTYLNKTKLDPESPSPITNGDEIMFGRLKFNVTLS